MLIYFHMTNTDKKVIIYSTPTCPYCVYAKNYFRSKNISFEDVDLSVQRNRIEEMVRKTGQMGVPVIDIDGQIVLGFQPEAFDRLLK